MLEDIDCKALCDELLVEGSVTSDERDELEKVFNWARATIAERIFKKDPGFGHHLCFYVNAYYANGLGYTIQRLVRSEVEGVQGVKVNSLKKRDFPDLLAYLAYNLYALKGKIIDIGLGADEPNKKVNEFKEDVRLAAAKNQHEAWRTEGIPGIINELRLKGYDYEALKEFEGYAIGLFKGEIKSVCPGSKLWGHPPRNEARDKKEELKMISSLYEESGTLFSVGALLYQIYTSESPVYTATKIMLGGLGLTGIMSAIKPSGEQTSSVFSAFAFLSSAVNLYYSDEYIRPLVILTAATMGAILNYKFIEINRELEKDLS